ncbi:MAG: YfbR-like 5'-deoxynucleotidase [Lawsonibacter sp.]
MRSFTGDMPTPIKYDNPDIQSAYKQVEAVAEQKLLNMLPEDLRPAYDEALTISDPQVRALVKAADKLSAYLKVCGGGQGGQQRVQKGQGTDLRRLLCQNQIPALRYFMDRFLDGFELTLDELSEE